MEKILILFLSLSLTIAQLLPFCILPASLFIKIVRLEENMEENIEENTEEDESDMYYEEETNKNTLNLTPNYTIELDGYGTISFNSSYFSLNESLSTSNKKILRYKDNKSKIIISTVTNLSDRMDIPGYITQEIAGVDTVTNDKYMWKDWMIIKSKNQINSMNVYVAYKLSKSSKHAMWLRIDVAPETDGKLDKKCDEQFIEDLIYKMLETAKVYYIGGTVFDTPTGGYYGDKYEEETTSGNTSDWESNDEDNKVHQNTQGFIDSDISSNWDSLEVIIDNKSLKIPMTVQELIDKGFVIDDKYVEGIDYKVRAGIDLKVTVTNKSNAYIDITVVNDSNSESKPIKDCRISSMVIDTSKFKYTADMGSDYIILPGGITTEIYTDNLIKTYGTPTKNQSVQEDKKLYKKLTWINGTKRVTIYCGVVAYINKIEIDSDY